MGDTTCDLCAENYYVASGSCVACAAGTTNDAGDNITAGSNTTCDQRDNDNSSSSSSDNTGMIAGVVVGVVALIGIVGVCMYMQGSSSMSGGQKGVEVTTV